MWLYIYDDVDGDDNCFGFEYLFKNQDVVGFNLVKNICPMKRINQVVLERFEYDDVVFYFDLFKYIRKLGTWYKCS